MKSHRTSGNAASRGLAVILGGALALSGIAVGCGNDYSTGAFPRIQVLADEQPIQTEAAGDVSFGQALQLSVRKQVQLINPGSKKVTITGIDWRLDEATGLRDVNPYVKLDWRGLVDGESSFPLTINAGDVVNGVIFDVVYSPPLNKPLDDFRPSVLVIRSDARTEDGSAPIEEVVVSFTMPQKIAAPIVNPPNYTYSNATPTKPQTQRFTISNNPDTGTAPFTVTAIDLDAVSNEFAITNLPSLPKVLEAPIPGQPQISETTFDITYTPQSSSSSGATIRVRVYTDVFTEPIIVPLSSNTLLGSWEISYFEPAKKFDFTNVNAKACRKANILSLGPGPITMRQPYISPDEAKKAFSFVCYKPATKPGEEDVAIDGVTKKYPQALVNGSSIDCEVCFEPPALGTEPSNGELVIPLDTPAQELLRLPLFAGAPKPKIVIGPASLNISISGDAASGDTGKRNLFIYNEGNGVLEIHGITVGTGSSGPSGDVFSLVAPPTEVLTVAPDGVLLVEIAWDSSKIKPGKEPKQNLAVVYYDPFTAQNQTENWQLVARDSMGAELPVANAGQTSDYAGAVVGEPILLDGSGSQPGAYEFNTKESPYIWNLVSKPAGSQTGLNAIGGPIVSVTPDKAGAYRFELVVFSSTDSDYLYSEPAQVQVDVAP
ncbi:MAG: hypothetical protein R3F39_18710 [Myxococcota bacterium]